MNIKAGKSAPDFNLQGSDGRSHSLKDYKGRMVVLYFYPRDNTPGCTKEACGFRDRQAEWDQLNATVLGVSRDSLESHDRFIADFKLPFVLLSDPDTKVMKAYGAWGKKMLYGKPVVGVIRSTVVIGPDGRVLKHWPAVKNAEDHPDDVMTYLRSWAAMRT